MVTQDLAVADSSPMLGPYGSLKRETPRLGSHGMMAKRLLTKSMLQQFTDGQWHALRDIAAFMETDLDWTRQLCHRLTRHSTFDTLGERRRAPPAQGGWSYRFVKGGKRLSLEAFYVEVEPVLDDMERLIYGHSVDFSQVAMKIAYQRFRQVIDRVAR